jgi:CheY-like chemotaxis protein
MMKSGATVVSPPLRIFLVENHKDTLLWLSRYLELMGHTVVTARTRSEALERLPGAACDVLISDIGLPDGDGWELLRTVRLSRPIYAIAMSGFGMTADHAKSEGAGYRHHILKPFDPSVLDAILEEAAREKINQSNEKEKQTGNKGLAPDSVSG